MQPGAKQGRSELLTRGGAKLTQLVTGLQSLMFRTFCHIFVIGIFPPRVPVGLPALQSVFEFPLDVVFPFLLMC